VEGLQLLLTPEVVRTGNEAVEVWLSRKRVLDNERTPEPSMKAAFVSGVSLMFFTKIAALHVWLTTRQSLALTRTAP